MNKLWSLPLPAVLRHRAEHQPHRRAFTFLSGRKLTPSHLTYGDLDLRARAIAAQLQDQCAANERALLLFPPGLDYVGAFLACQYSRIVAVPTYPPDPSRFDQTLNRLVGIIKDAQVSVVLTTSEIAGLGKALSERMPALGRLAWLATDTVPDALSEAW